MSIYALRNTETLEVLSIVEYDGSSSYDYLNELGLELYSGSIIEEFTAKEHTPYDLYDPVHGLHITSEVGSVLKGFTFISGSTNIIGNVISTGSFYLEGDSTMLGTFDISGSFISSGSIEITGSLTVDGDFFVGDEKIDEIFKTAPKPCTVLKYNESTIYITPPQIGDGGINPQGGYFVFDKDTSVNGDYGNDSWAIVKPTKIRLSLYSLGEDLQQNEYEQKLFRIIKEKLAGSIIELDQILPNELEGTSGYKKFEVITGTYRERTRRMDTDRSYPVKYYYLNWGDPDFTETDQFTGQEDVDYFAGLDFNSIGQNSARDGFFEFEVNELQSWDPTYPPQQDAEFRTCIKLKKYKIKVDVFRSGGTYEFPFWADRVTMYAVGAGGGGGGGAWGYPHDVTTKITSLFRSTYGNLGHDIVMGGGGGAGGSVSINSFSNLDIPNGSVFDIFVDNIGGKGGQGLSYNQQFINKQTKHQYKNFYEPKPFGVSPYNEFNRHHTSNPIAEIVFGGEFVYTPMQNDRLDSSDKSISVPLDINIGKKGGDSIVSLRRSREILVKAQGGSGGNCGVSIAGHYPMDHHTCERSMPDSTNYNDLFNTHLQDFASTFHSRPRSVALGGGGSVQESIGWITHPGGHGGYGTCTPQIYNRRFTARQRKWGFDINTTDMNVAPNIPWNANGDLLSLKLPMGRLLNNMPTYIQLYATSDESSIEIYDSNYYGVFSRDVLSKEMPNELAPPGGGGGFGIRFLDISNNTFIGFNDGKRVVLKEFNTKENQIGYNYTYIMDNSIIESNNNSTNPNPLINAKITNNTIQLFLNTVNKTRIDVKCFYNVSTKSDEAPSAGEIVFDTNVNPPITKIHILDKDGNNREQQILASVQNQGKNSPIWLTYPSGDVVSIFNVPPLGTNFNDFMFKKIDDYYVIVPDKYGINNTQTTSPSRLINFKGYTVEVTLNDALELSSNMASYNILENAFKSNIIRTIIFKNGATYLSAYEIDNNFTMGDEIDGIIGFSIPILNSFKYKQDISTYVDKVTDNSIPTETHKLEMYLESVLWSDYGTDHREFNAGQRIDFINKYAKLGEGGKVRLPNKDLIDVTDSDNNRFKLTFDRGGNGGFGEYYETYAAAYNRVSQPIKPNLFNTLPEDVSDKIGVGGGGGAGVYLKKYSDKDLIGQPGIPEKGQDGADGAPGIVVMIAEGKDFV